MFILMQKILRILRIKFILMNRGRDEECGSIIFIPKLQKLASNKICPDQNPLRLTQFTVHASHNF